MSNFTTIYDQLIGTTIPGLTGFSTKTQIPNPYEIDQNDKNLLRNGWGITVGGSSNSPHQEYKYTKVNQSFGFVLSREVKGTHHNTVPLQTATKNLVEDSVLIRLDLYNSDQISIDSNIENILYTGRSPVQFIDEDGFNIIWTTVSFIFEIKETI